MLRLIEHFPYKFVGVDIFPVGDEGVVGEPKLIRGVEMLSIKKIRLNPMNPAGQLTDLRNGRCHFLHKA